MTKNRKSSRRKNSRKKLSKHRKSPRLKRKDLYGGALVICPACTFRFETDDSQGVCPVCNFQVYTVHQALGHDHDWNSVLNNLLNEVLYPERDIIEPLPLSSDYIAKVYPHSYSIFNLNRNSRQFGDTDTERLTNLARDFTNLHGSVLFAPNLPENPDPSFKIGIQPNDLLYPICHQGLNRSQVMFLALLGLKHAMKSNLEDVYPAHGAESGFDPFVLPEELTDENYFAYIHAMDSPTVDLQTKCFFDAFGRTRSTRARQREIEALNLKLNPSYDVIEWERIRANRAIAREDFSTNYWGTFLSDEYDFPEQRKVLITFCGATLIALERLIEVARASGRFLNNVVIVGLPFSDPIAMGSDKTAINNYLILNRLPNNDNECLKAQHVLTTNIYVQMFKQYVNLLAPTVRCEKRY